MLRKEQWRVEGEYINKGPFPAPSTEVRVMEWNRNDDTGEVTLKVTPVNGDTVFYEIGGEATTASAKVEDFQSFVTKDMHISFLCVDSKGAHEKGATYKWANSVILKKRVFGDSKKKTVELKAAPTNATIRYTTEGSSPKNAGGIYSNPFNIDKPTKVILAVAEKEGVESEVLELHIDWEDDGLGLKPELPASWKLRHNKKLTKDSFDFTGQLKKHNASAQAVKLSINGGKNYWVELNVSPAIELSGEQIEKLIESLREICSDGQVSIDVPVIKFETGQDLKYFADAEKSNIKMDEVSQ